MASAYDDDDDEPDKRRPELHMTAVERMELRLRTIDGIMSVGNMAEIDEANDVGENVRENPRASDLGYPEGADPDSYVDDNLDVPRLVLQDIEQDGHVVHAEEGSYIDDVTKWA